MRLTREFSNVLKEVPGHLGLSGIDGKNSKDWQINFSDLLIFCVVFTHLFSFFFLLPYFSGSNFF